MIRKADQEDLDDLLWYKANSWPGTHRFAWINRADQQHWFEAFDGIAMISYYVFPGDSDFTIHRSKVGVMLATDIDWVAKIAKFTGGLFENFRGKGIAKLLYKANIDFLFKHFGFHRLEAEIPSDNPRSRTAAEHAGLKYEGTKKQAVYRPDGYIDSYCFGVLRNDWLNRD